MQSKREVPRYWRSIRLSKKRRHYNELPVLCRNEDEDWRTREEKYLWKKGVEVTMTRTREEKKAGEGWKMVL